MLTAYLAGVEGLMQWLVLAAWQAGLLAIAVFAICLLLGERLQATWRFCLWLVVLGRLALPIVPTAPWGLFHGGNGEEAVAARSETVPATTMVKRDLDSVASAPQVAPASVVEDEPVTATVENAAVTGVVQPIIRWKWNWMAFLGGVWLTGVLVLLARFAVNVVGLSRQQRQWRDVEDGALRALFQECKEELNVARRVSMRLSSQNMGPATCGVFWPTIVLPEELVSQVSKSELRLILLHELVHVKRWDVLVDQLASAIAAVHWFHPVGWLARYCLRHERELACDAAVLRQATLADATDYGRVILKTVEVSSLCTFIPGLVGIFSRRPPSLLERRIRMIASYQRPSRFRWLAGGAVVGMAVLVGLTNGEVGEEEKSAKQLNAVAPEPIKDPPADKNPRPAIHVQNIEGVCLDASGKPLEGTKVYLYRVDHDGSQRVVKLATSISDGKGGFRFEIQTSDLNRIKENLFSYAIVATCEGLSSCFHYVVDANGDAKPITLHFYEPTTLAGRVTDQEGKAVSGAVVFAQWLGDKPISEAFSAITDADGRYLIKDLEPFDIGKIKPVKGTDGRFSIAGSRSFMVVHPGFSVKSDSFAKLPATVDVQLEPAATLDGKVVDIRTGKPIAKVRVMAVGMPPNETPGLWLAPWEYVAFTDEQGEYHFSQMRGGEYNVLVFDKDHIAAAIPSLQIKTGKVVSAPDLKLLEGGVIEGQVLNAETGEPLVYAFGTKELVGIGVFGPSHPKNSMYRQEVVVDANGKFQVRVAPGINYPFLTNNHRPQDTSYPVDSLSQLNDQVLRKDEFAKGIEVKEGEVVQLTFRVMPVKTLKNPEIAPVRLIVPVEEERAAAEAIRKLGGWYEVDDQRRVIEVNMSYHETKDGVRYDNAQRDTDRALRQVGAFKKLRRLYLCEGQATDDAMEAVKGLSELERFYVWDSAKRLSDVGVRHLAGLTNLQEIHINSAKLSDESLMVFGKLPNIQRLSLQTSEFTNAGLKHLAGAKQLKALWIGRGLVLFSDEGIADLQELTELEVFDLQGSELSDVGVGRLASLKKLRRLYLRGAGREGARITDASVDTLLLMRELEELHIYTASISDVGVAKLCELPKLQRLQVSTSDVNISNANTSELQKKFPKVKISIHVENEGE